MIACLLRWGAALGVCAALAGCLSAPSQQVTALPAAPSQPVQRQQLPPPPETDADDPADQNDPDAPIAEEGLPGDETGETQVAAAPQASAIEVGRTDLLGGWAIASAGETCQLFISLSSWTGGYRASTRGCTSPTLASISAWDLSGNTVTLKGGDAASTVASLSATAPQRFTGSTTDGAAVTVSR